MITCRHSFNWSSSKNYNSEFPCNFSEMLGNPLSKFFSHAHFKNVYEAPVFQYKKNKSGWGIGSGPDAEIFDRWDRYEQENKHDRHFSISVMELHAYYFIINAWSEVNTRKILSNMFSKIDEIKEWSQDDKDKTKTNLMNRIAESAQQAVDTEKYKKIGEKVYMEELMKGSHISPCFTLNMELASYISIETTKQVWCNLNFPDTHFIPQRNFDIALQSTDTFEIVKSKIHQMLLAFYTIENTFMGSLLSKRHSQQEKTFIQEVNKCLSHCKYMNQIKNLFYCALNVANGQFDSSCLSSFTTNTFYQILLTGLQISNNFLHPSKELEKKPSLKR